MILRLLFQQTLAVFAGFIFLGAGSLLRHFLTVPRNPYVIFGVFVVAMVIAFTMIASRAVTRITGAWNVGSVVLCAIIEWCLCIYFALLIWADNYGT